MPQAEGPCSAAKYDATLFDSLLTMKLMSPCRYSVTSLERCFATRVKPSISNTGSRTPGADDANSTNSKPMSPIGLSKRSGIVMLLVPIQCSIDTSASVPGSAPTIRRSVAADVNAAKCAAPLASAVCRRPQRSFDDPPWHRNGTAMALHSRSTGAAMALQLRGIPAAAGSWRRCTAFDGSAARAIIARLVREPEPIRQGARSSFG